MKLHYSQTVAGLIYAYNQFYYLMKLHYSQTQKQWQNNGDKFYYLMKLHYSQTDDLKAYRENGFTTL